ncbi:MAG TPA: hypothetical protein VGS80_06850 [Ktedonobacterales bacterium]|nr:hypothetical protein [Ktedonobacterales bacterium]
MPTPRKPTVLTTAAIDQFCAAFDDLFVRLYVHSRPRCGQQARRPLYAAWLLPPPQAYQTPVRAH